MLSIDNSLLKEPAAHGAGGSGTGGSAMSAHLTDRVARNYAPQDIAGQGSPIEIMSLIYPEMFGSGLKSATAWDERASV